VASIARDDPSPFPGMHCHHNVPAGTATRSACPQALRLAVHAGAVWAATTMQGKFGSGFET